MPGRRALLYADQVPALRRAARNSWRSSKPFGFGKARSLRHLSSGWLGANTLSKRILITRIYERWICDPCLSDLHFRERSSLIAKLVRRLAVASIGLSRRVLAFQHDSALRDDHEVQNDRANFHFCRPNSRSFR